MTKQTIQCPDCDNDTFRIHREEAVVDIRDVGPIGFTKIYAECSECGFQFVTPEQARDHDRQVKENGPYITTLIVDEERSYNPKYGDDRTCVCGHLYYRHFDTYDDTYDDMHAVGCKYCVCYKFVEHICAGNLTGQRPGAGEPVQSPFCKKCGEEFDKG